MQCLFGIFLIGFVKANDINNCNDLQNMNSDLGGTWNLKQDIDCSGINFQAVGNIYNPFTGTLNGNKHIISNLHGSGGANPENSGTIALFGKTKGATITNIGLKNVNIDVTGNSQSNYFGTLIGLAYYTNINGVFAIGSVTAPSTYWKTKTKAI